MSHAHAGGGQGIDRRFAAGTVLNLAFVAAEAAFGIVSGSLALLADAGHNLSDVAGLLLAWGAYRLGRRPPTARHTYGWRSASILAALGNAVLLLVAVGAIGWEAVGRFRDPGPVASTTMIWVAAAGVVLNALTALFFLRDRHEDLNIRGAFLHMVADAGVSAGVVAAGLAIRFTGITWLDPAVSLAIGAVILVTTWGLLREALHLVLSGVPREIDLDEVRAYLEGLPGVEGVHDLHVWPLSTTETALTGHLVKPDPEGGDALLQEATRVLRERFHISHSTLQWEREGQDDACPPPC